MNICSSVMNCCSCRSRPIQDIGDDHADALEELKIIHRKHSRVYDPLSSRIVEWIKNTLTHQSNLKQDHQSRDIQRDHLRSDIKRLVQEILINSLDGAPCEAPVTIRNKVWERWMYDDCAREFTVSPLDGGPMSPPTPHRLAMS